MALKGQPIAVGTSDTTIYTCPASTEASVHGLVFANNTGSAVTVTLKIYTQSTGLTTTTVTGLSVSANTTQTWPKPINVNSGDIIKASASSGSAIVCLYSVYEGSAPAVAVGFTPRGAWSSGASYVTNDVVSYTNGNSYLAIQAGTNQQPDTQTAYWMLLAEKGNPGAGTGDVVGPASATDNAVVRFDGTTGKLVQNSAATIADTTGDITAGKYNGLTVSTSTGTLTIANGKTLATDNTVTFVGTDSSTVNYGTGGTIAYTGNKLSAFSATTSSELAGVISDETGSGSLVFANSPTLVSPALGTPSSGTLTNCTSLPISSGVSGLGANVATALAVNVGTVGSPVVNGGALGTPSSGTLTNATGLPLTTGVTGTLPVGNGGTGVATVTGVLKGNGTSAISAATAGTDFVAPGTVTTFTAAQRGAYSVLTDGATITPDFAVANMFRVQLAGNRTLANPTNLVEGQSGSIDIYQDNTGSRTLSYQWGWDFVGGAVPTLSTAARAKDKLVYQVDVAKSSTVTITIASPGVVSWTAHGLQSGQQVRLTTTGALPTGLATGTTYFVVSVDANTFQLSATQNGTAINTSGSQSGTHTMTATSITAQLLAAIL